MEYFKINPENGSPDHSWIRILSNIHLYRYCDTWQNGRQDLPGKFWPRLDGHSHLT